MKTSNSTRSNRLNSSVNNVLPKNEQAFLTELYEAYNPVPYPYDLFLDESDAESYFWDCYNFIPACDDLFLND